MTAVSDLLHWQRKAQALGAARLRDECGDAYVLLYAPPLETLRQPSSTIMMEDIVTQVTNLVANIRASSARTDGLERTDVAAELSDPGAPSDGEEGAPPAEREAAEAKNAALPSDNHDVALVPQVFAVRRRLGSKVSFVSLGRMPNLDIQVNEPSVSRFHAHFREEPEGVRLRDAVSNNGTFVNGKPATAAGILVSSGDALRFGRVEGFFYNAEALCAALKTL